MASRVFDFLLSGINSIVKLGKRGNTIESHTDSHIEFKNTTGDLLPVRTANPIDQKDSVNLEFLRENVLLSYGLPVQSIAELQSIPETERRDKQMRLVEDEEAFYQFDVESVAVVPDPDNPKKSVLPNDLTISLPGRWLKAKGRTQYHADLIGNDSGDDHPQYQLRSEKDNPEGYLGIDSFGNLNADTDSLPEGPTNLYFTEERARLASVENQILPGEVEKAPSQDAVDIALSLKEDGLGNGTPDQFLDGNKNWRQVEIQDIPGLEVGIQAAFDEIGILQNSKEDSLPSGNPGEYLHSDKTFKPINYSEIVGTPPPASGGSSPEIVFIFSNFSDITKNIFNNWQDLLTAHSDAPWNQPKAIILEDNATWDMTGQELAHNFSKTRFYGRPKTPPLFNPSISTPSTVNNIYRNVPRPRLILTGTPEYYQMQAPYLIENIAIIIENTVGSSIINGETAIFSASQSDYIVKLKDFSFYSNVSNMKLFLASGGVGSGTTFELDGECEIDKVFSSSSTSLIDYSSVYSASENHNIIIRPGAVGQISMLALIGQPIGFDGSGNNRLKLYMASISIALKKDIPNFLTSESKIQLIDLRFKPSLNGLSSAGLDDFDSMVSLGGKQIRNDIHPLTLTNLGNYSLDSLTFLNCAVSGIYSKQANGNSTIYLFNIGIGQQVILEVVSNGSPSVLTFQDAFGSPIIWLDGSQPTPSTTSGNTDLYVFLKMQSKIYVSTFMDL